MRFFYLIFLLSLFSCSDSTDLTEELQSTGTPTPSTHRQAGHPAYNSHNPYEYSGELFDDLFSSYYASDSLPTSAAGIVNRVNKVAGENMQFGLLQTATYSAVSSIDVYTLLDNPSQCMLNFTNASALSVTAKSSLAGFMNGVVTLSNTANDYQTIYDYIVAYENGILTDTSLTSYDRRVVLTTSSITRYSAYRKRKKPKKKEDPEWDLLITHLTAGASGAELGVCESTSRALATGIMGQP